MVLNKIFLVENTLDNVFQLYGDGNCSHIRQKNSNQNYLRQGLLKVQMTKKNSRCVSSAMHLEIFRKSAYLNNQQKIIEKYTMDTVIL